MNWKNTTKNLIINDNTMNSKLEIQEIELAASGQNVINFKLEDHSSIDLPTIEVALNQKDVQNLVEKLNTWLRNQ